CRLRGLPGLLAGRLFDEGGNRMSPTHTNKRGARYRYYVSQTVLQNKSSAAGAIGRVPAAEIEALVLAGLRNYINASGGPHSGIISFLVQLSDGHLIQTGMVGRAGVAGASQALDGRVSLNKIVVQVPGRRLSSMLIPRSVRDTWL